MAPMGQVINVSGDDVAIGPWHGPKPAPMAGDNKAQKTGPKNAP